MTVGELAVYTLMRRALEGTSSQSERLLWDHLAGPITQKHEHSGAIDAPYDKAAVQAILSDPDSIEHIEALEDRLRAVQMAVSVQST